MFNLRLWWQRRHWIPEVGDRVRFTESFMVYTVTRFSRIGVAAGTEALIQEVHPDGYYIRFLSGLVAQIDKPTNQEWMLEIKHG